MKRNSLTITFFKVSALLLLLLMPLAAQSKREQVRKLKDKAAAAEKLKNYREAADAYAQVLGLTPNDADAHYRKGFAHYSLKENDQAISDFTAALTKGYKPHINIYKVRYVVYLDQKNYDAVFYPGGHGPMWDLAEDKHSIQLIESFYTKYAVIEFSKPLLLKASTLRGQHAFSFWDSIIVASALATNATVLYSEDMQDGLLVENRLRIVNPFKESLQTAPSSEGGSA